MPLTKGYSRKTIRKNIHKMKEEGRPYRVARAAALNTAERAAKATGKPSKAPKRKKAKR